MLRALVLVAVLAPAALAGETTRTEAAGLRLAVPTAWTRVPAPSDVRAAQWRLPRATGDAEDGEVILFFFGAGKGGGPAENLERWYGQFTPVDGRPARDAAVITKRTVHSLRVTSIDLAGAYRAAPSGAPKPGFHLLAAVIEGPGGPWFLKAVGPEGTVAGAKEGFEAVLASLEAHR